MIVFWWVYTPVMVFRLLGGRDKDAEEFLDEVSDIRWWQVVLWMPVWLPVVSAVVAAVVLSGLIVALGRTVEFLGWVVCLPVMAFVRAVQPRKE